MPTPITWDSGVRFDQPGITWDGVLPDPVPPAQTPPLPPNLNPLNMHLNTSIDFLKLRIDKTRSVQAQIAADWLWPLRSLGPAITATRRLTLPICLCEGDVEAGRHTF